MNPSSNPEQPNPTEIDYTQPVTYDTNGRPLYAHLPKAEAAKQQEPQLVQVVRPLDPPQHEMTPEVRQRHEESLKKYPFLNLSDGEYVIRDMRRHPIGLFWPMFLGTLLLIVTLSAMLSYPTLVEAFNIIGPAADPSSIVLPGILFCILIGLGMFVAYYVYSHNKFFLTNESVIQEIQDSLFARHEQTVSLGNIEDASFRQNSLIQHIFHYGTIRLSTEGDETTYMFTYVANPKEHIATLNTAVESFKLGRPVNPQDN